MCFPSATPLAVDSSRPFPHVSNLSLNLAVVLEGPGGGSRFALVKVPSHLPRFLRLSEGEFISVENMLCANLDQLFVGMKVTAQHCFRVTRELDLALDDAGKAPEPELSIRASGTAVRSRSPPTLPAS